MKEQTFTLRNWIFSILLMLFFISFSVVVTLNFRPLYYFDIDYLDIEELSGFDEEKIRENYDVLIDYNQMCYEGELKFPSLVMSREGRIHFEEVKAIFVGIQYVLIADFFLCIVLLIWHIRKKSFGFLKLTGIVTLVTPVILFALIGLNWQFVFVTFHRIAFDNDYWIFDSATDPVIDMLPDAFFMHCALMILVLVTLCAVGCLIAGKRLTGKRSRSKRKGSN